MHSHTLDASESASVVLTIGAGVGALILYVPASELSREIEISPAGTHAPRTHAAVRERKLDDGSRYCVVYDGLPEGDYTLWDDDTTPAGTATVTGGQVTEVDWTLVRPGS
jgi:hypothetical protein